MCPILLRLRTNRGGGKDKKMNKIGAAQKTSPALWVIVIVGVLFVGLASYAIFGRGTGTQQTQLTGTQVVEGGAGETTTGGGQAATIVTSNPIWNINGKDKQQTGTSVSSSVTASINDGGYSSVTLGTTTAVPGQTFSALLTNGTTYHNVYWGEALANDANVHQGSKTTVTPGIFPLTVFFNKNATVTENMYTTTGLVLANGLGVQNQTDLGNGAAYTFKDEMQAGSLTNTQDMICVVEIEAGQNASTTPVGASMDLEGVAIPLKSTDKPDWYTSLGGNSKIYQFEVAPLSTSAVKTFHVSLQAKSTGRFSAATRMIKSCYTKEYFEDPNTGLITYDVADSDGTVKSMARYIYTVYFQ